MKHIFCSLCTLLVILLFSFWNASVVTQMSDFWCVQIAQATALAKEDRWEEAAETIKKSHRDWSSRQQYLHIILKHDAIEEAQMMYHRAIAFAQTKADAEFLAEAESLTALLKILAEEEQFSLNNLM
jgi:hypothetical protein